MPDAFPSIHGRSEWDRVPVASAFDRADTSHREQMWIARVALSFKYNFRRPEPGSPLIPCTLAFVTRLRGSTAQEARKSHSLHFPYALN